MVVVKIGGSLQSTQYIKKWIHEIKLNRNTSFLLVFGGGRYAEKIRKDQIRRRYQKVWEGMGRYENEELAPCEGKGEPGEHGESG